MDETLKRIQAHKGVVGTIVVNAEGNTPVFLAFIYLIDTFLCDLGLYMKCEINQSNSSGQS